MSKNNASALVQNSNLEDTSALIPAASTASALTIIDGSTIPVLLDKEKVKTIRAKLSDRTFFVSIDDGESAYQQAENHLAKVSAETDNFYGLTIQVNNGPADRPLESANCVCVATIGVRDKKTSTNGYKGIVVFEAPTVEAFLSSDSDAARAFIAKLIEREATDVAFQAIRAASTIQELEAAVSGMPTTVEDIVVSSRESAGSDMDAFNALWQTFRAGVLKPKYPQVDAVLPQKPEVVKALRSKSYALANPKTEALEKSGLLVKIGAALVKAGAVFKDDKGQPSPVDTSSIQAWLDERDNLNLTYQVPTVSSDELAGIDF